MKPIRPYSFTAPGFAGLNTNDAPVDLDQKFALVANNCVIDKYGRIGSRKGWTKVSTNTNVELGTSSITAICEFISTAGVSTILGTGNNHLYKLVGSTWTTLTYGGGGAAPTITTDNWQIVFLSTAAVFFQRGYDPLIYDIAVSTTTYRRMSEHATYTGTIPKAHCALTAYGRIWCADTDTETMTVTWCDTNTFQHWTAGTAGSLNLSTVWPNGGDRIVALAAHNNFLIIFGTRQILVYQGANVPSTMTLYDTVAGVGCAGRDTVQNTEDDLIFLSTGGVRSLGRTIQEKSMPFGDLSINVDSDIKAYVAATATDAIKSGYSQSDSLYVVTFTTSLISYCFDTRVKLDNGALRATTWTGNVPSAYYYTKDKNLYMGEAGFLGKYSGYLDNVATYHGSWYTPWVDFGDPERTSILKQISATLIGASNQEVIFKWGFDYSSAENSFTTTIAPISSTAQYNVSEFGIAEYAGGTAIKKVKVNGSGEGEVVQAGIEFDVNGTLISIQHFGMYTKDGRY